MATPEEVRAEAERRGLRSPRQMELLAEAERRGLEIPGQRRTFLENVGSSIARSAESFLGTAETGVSIATGAIGEGVGGILGSGEFVGGTAAGASPKETAEEAAEASQTIATVSDALRFQPRTKAGKDQLKAFGGLVQSVIDTGNQVAAKAIGLVAPETGERVSESGLGRGLGDTAEAAGAPPAVSALVSTLPTALTSAGGGAGAAGSRAAALTARRVTPQTRQAARPFQDAKLGGDFGQEVADAIIEPTRAREALVDQAYGAARARAQGGEVVRTANAARFLRANEGADQISRGVVSSLRQTMENFGLIEGGRIVRGKRLSVEDAEALRAEANTLFDSTSGKGREILAKFKEALDSDVARAVGEDVFLPARREFARFKRTLDRTKASEFDTSSRNLVNNILTNRITPDQISARLKKPDTQDLRQLVKFVDEANIGREPIKRAVLRNFFEAAQTSARSYGKAVDDFDGGSNRLSILFNAREIRQIKSLKPKRGEGVAEAATEGFFANLSQNPLFGFAVAPVRAVSRQSAARNFDRPLKEAP